MNNSKIIESQLLSYPHGSPPRKSYQPEREKEKLLA